MVKIVVQTKSIVPTGEVAGVAFKTITVDSPELEAFLRNNNHQWAYSSVVGAEIVEVPEESPREEKKRKFFGLVASE